MSITARLIAVKDIRREATIFIRGDAMNRDEYLRRASALEKRAADFVYPGLRTALLNTAAQYRNRANQQWSAEQTPSSPLTSTLAAQSAIRVSRLP
jgi:hypothetical protein